MPAWDSGPFGGQNHKLAQRQLSVICVFVRLRPCGSQRERGQGIKLAICMFVSSGVVFWRLRSCCVPAAGDEVLVQGRCTCQV